MNRRILQAMGLLAAMGLVACDDGDGDGAGGEGGLIIGAGGEGGGAGGAGGGQNPDMGGEGGEGGGVQAAVQSLSIAPAGEYLAGKEHRFVVTATYDDGSTGELQAVEWSSSNEDIVSFADGVATFPYGGSATITAAVGGVSATLDVTVECDYPRFPANIVLGQAVAPVEWTTAFDETGAEFPFSLREASCSAEFKDFSSFILIVNAEWCPPCQAEIRDLGPEAEHLESLGTKLVFITLQNLNYGPINAQNASRFIDRYARGIRSIRTGIIGSNPERFFNNDAIIQAFPSSFVVRKRDMRVIADSRGLQYALHPLFELIVSDIEADWSDPRANVMFMNECGAGDEEAQEPNNTPAEATPIVVGDRFSAGICDVQPDYWQIDADGPWTFTVEFSHAIGDIDMAFAGPDGRPLADRPAANSGDDNEVLQGEGAALIVVYGFNGASAPYTVSLTAR